MTKQARVASETSATHVLSAAGYYGEDDPSRKAEKSREDASAIGGLRSPHKSIQYIPAAKVIGKRMQTRLNELMEASAMNWDEALGTLGQPEADTPVQLQTLALQVRRELEAMFKTD